MHIWNMHIGTPSKFKLSITQSALALRVRFTGVMYCGVHVR